MLSPNINPNENLSSGSPDEKKTLEDFMSSKFRKVTIDTPFKIFNDKVLEEKATSVNYGILELLEGDWYSHVEDNSKRISNIRDGEFKKNFGSGIHTTIMPSPGTTQNNIPGKFSFECDEYIEKLSFDLVEGGVRNRGGANEQFCGAVKYEQSIKGLITNKLVQELLIGLQSDYINQKIKEANKRIEEDNKKIDPLESITVYLDLPVEDFKKEVNELKNSLDTIINQVNALEKTDLHNSLLNLLSNLRDLLVKASKDDSFSEAINDVNSENKETLLKDFLLGYEKIYQAIHEENGMYLWLSDLYKNPATEASIKNDRGVHRWDNEKGIQELFKNLYPSTPDKIESENFKNIVKAHPFLDATLYNVNTIDIPNYVLVPPSDKQIVSVVPAKELQSGEGIGRPNYVPDYSISRSGVIPHGSTITLLGDLKREAGSFLIKGGPMFVNPSVGTWDKAHLALSDSMGTGISPTNPLRPFDLYNPPLPFTPTEDFNEENDPGEEEVYTQQLFQHNLYPYSVRPDLRLRDAIKNQNIKNHIKIEMFTKKDEGTQGGIINIPFVNKFVPTVNMKMNMWLETVIEGEKEILQLQYEQIVFFEFGFGDNGGTTSWPHIQVNTLRKYEDLNNYSKVLAEQQFIQPAQEALRKKVERNQELKIAEAGKCPFGHTSKNS